MRDWYTWGSMARLIVNADDFGYTPGVNQAILELHQAGALSSTTLMAAGPAADHALAALRLDFAARPDPALRLDPSTHHAKPLGVGCHVVLVDGQAVSPPARIATLLSPVPPFAAPHGISRASNFRPSLPRFVFDLLCGRIRESEIELEATAQIRSLQAGGIHVTHLDTHKHTHMFPRVLRPLLRAAVQCGVPAIRNPFEPAWSRNATSKATSNVSFKISWLRRAEVSTLARLQPSFLQLVEQAGLRTTAGSLGVLATGTLNPATLQTLLAAFADRAEDAAVYELVCHPGYRDRFLDALPTRLGQERETERAAFLAVKHRLQSLPLIHFGDLPSLTQSACS